MIIREMTRDECIAIISESRVAHLACASNDQPYVVPIHYAFADNHLYSFSMPGQKIDWMRLNAKICLQIDLFGRHREWTSVVVFGTFEELPDRMGWKHQREYAWSLLEQHTNWWEPGSLKPIPGPVPVSGSHLFYRVKLESVTGRRAMAE